MKPIDETSVKPYLTPGQKALRKLYEEYRERKQKAAIADTTQSPPNIIPND